MKYLFFILILSFTACSNIEFVQDGKIKYKISSIKGSEKIVEKVDVAPFYFWGLFPKKSTVNLSDEFFEMGVHNPSMVKIERINDVTSVLYTLITLGLYMPEPYRISVYSVGEEH